MTQDSSSPDLQDVWKGFWKGFSRVLLKEAPQAWQGPQQTKFRAERDAIVQHLQPVGMGLFVTRMDLLSRFNSRTIF